LFLEGGGSEREREVVDVHVDGCDVCRALLIALARTNEDSESALSSPRAKRPARRRLAELEAGSEVGRYIVMNEIGAGGMGTVHAAYDPELDREVAIKVLNRQRTVGSEGEQARMLREARALAKLSHQNIVQAYDAGTTADGEVFIAMELVDGLTLREWLAAEPRSWREVVDKFIQAGDGLVAAHAAEMVHRDFKPENVLVGSDGRVRIGDFGLVRIIDTVVDDTGPALDDSQPTTMTRTGVALGTPAYMAPEQLAGAAVDHRCDQFSFCVALYEALAGERPFVGGDVSALTVAMTKPTPALPASTDVPAWLGNIVARGLERDRDARFANMKELVARLRAGLVPRRRHGVRTIAVAAVAVGLGAAVVVLTSGGSPTKQTCAAPQELDQAWNASMRSKLRGVFLGVKHKAPKANWKIIERRLDEHVGGLRNLYKDHCSTQDAQLSKQRRVCLDRRSDEVAAFISVFTDGKKTEHKVARASHALEYLMPLDDCSRPTYLGGIRVAPVSPEATALRRDIALVGALARMRLGDDALKLAETTRLAAQKLGVPQLEARAIRAMALSLVLREQAVAIALLDTAAEKAERDDLPLLAARLRLIHTKYSRDDGALWNRAAEAVRRAGNDPALTNELLHIRAKIQWIRSRTGKKTRRLLEQVLAAADKRKRPNYARLIRHLRGLGRDALTRGEPVEAKRYFSRGLALATRYLGDYHRYTLNMLYPLARLARESGDYPAAVAYFDRAVPLLRTQLGADHPTTIQASIWSSEVLAISGTNLARALTILDDVERLVKAPTARAHHLLPKIWQGKAVVFERRSHLKRAAAYFERAVEAQRKRYGEKHEQFIRAVIRLAKIYSRMRQYAQAVVIIRKHLAGVERITQKRAGLASVLLALGDALHRLGKLDEAQPVLERALTADPPGTTNRRDSAMIRHQLAMLLWRKPAQRSRAIGLSKQAREYAKELPSRWDSFKRAIDKWLATHTLNTNKGGK